MFQRFTDDLRRRYGSIERLNEEWGLVYWSHRLSCWEDRWLPDGNAQPQYELAWRRFQARLTREFITWQAGIVRSLAREDQFVTTCIAYDRPAVDDVSLTGQLDVTAGNARTAPGRFAACRKFPPDDRAPSRCRDVVVDGLAKRPATAGCPALNRSAMPRWCRSGKVFRGSGVAMSGTVVTPHWAQRRPC